MNEWGEEDSEEGEEMDEESEEEGNAAEKGAVGTNLIRGLVCFPSHYNSICFKVCFVYSILSKLILGSNVDKKMTYLAIINLISYKKISSLMAAQAKTTTLTSLL